MTFYDWLQSCPNQGRCGRLAGFVRKPIPSFPDTNDKKEIRAWVKSRTKWKVILDDFDFAWSEYASECRSASSVVYFVQSGESGPIKIGYTSKGVKSRIAALQTAHPERLHVLLVISGDRKRERDLHKQFSHYRRSGEWFNPDSELLGFVNRLFSTSKENQ